MAEFPLRGNGIEIRGIFVEETTGRQQHDVYVDAHLHLRLKDGANWRFADSGRRILDYYAVESPAEAEAFRSLYVEGIDVHRKERRDGGRSTFRISVAPNLQILLTEEGSSRDSGEEVSGGDVDTESIESAEVTSVETRKTRSVSSASAEAGNESVADLKDGWNELRNGKWVFGYSFTDTDFLVATPVTGCRSNPSRPGR